MTPLEMATEDLVPGGGYTDGVWTEAMYTPIQPTVTLSSSQNPSTYGSPVTFTAQFNYPLKGTVHFSSLHEDLGAIPINGTAVSITSSSLRAGTEYITVNWGGDDTYGPAYVDLQQVINKATPVITWPTPTPITYGTTLSGNQLNASLNVPGSCSYGQFTGQLLAAGSYSLSVSCAPSDSNDYYSVGASVPLSVLKATPAVYAWPSAGAITYGQSLSSSALLGGNTSVSGTFTWNSPGFQPSTSSAPQALTFIPSDTANYNSVTTALAVPVYKATPTIFAWPSASAISFGQSLASSSLVGGSASVSGTFGWSSPSSYPAVGSSMQAITFTPNDTSNYNSVGGTTAVSVTKASPAVLSWPSATSITYGQPVSASVLSGGSASVPGSFIWASPEAKPLAGSSAQAVLFMPNDTTNYVAIGNSIPIAVNKATPVINWESPVDLAYGVPLSSTQLNASVAGIGGKFSYDPPLGAVLDVGVHILTATFMPDDIANFNKASATVIIGVAVPEDVYKYHIDRDEVGNVTSSSDSINGNWTFAYDKLNRLVRMNPSFSAGQYYCWNYDSFGNRKHQMVVTGDGFTSDTACTPKSGATLLANQWALYTVDGTSTSSDNQRNRLTGTSSGIWRYDESGNVLADGTSSGSSHEYLYDVEGRICAERSIGNIGGTMYIYDAAGNRVAKGTISSWSCDITNNGFTPASLYVVTPGGQQLTEMTWNSNSAQWQWQHTNVFAGSDLVATYSADSTHPTTGNLYFHLSDWLGTRRVQTDYRGIPDETYTSLPYGDCSSGGSTDCIGGATEHHFTGKERDSESGNDYFLARYYSNSLGRFLSPDWSVSIEPVPYAKLDNPQSLNLYIYVFNNPVSGVDLTGHFPSINRDLEQWSNWVDEQDRLLAEKQQLLATFSALANNYPGHAAYPTDPNAPNSIWSLIGGHVAMNAWTTDENGNPVPNNTCAIRMSYDLNHSGLTIPKGKGTVSGADGSQYFLRVADLQRFLTSSLGSPQRLAGGSFVGPNGSTGIISFNIPFKDATGHFTLWNGHSVIDSHEPYQQWPKPTSILFWGVQ